MKDPRLLLAARALVEDPLFGVMPPPKLPSPPRRNRLLQTPDLGAAERIAHNKAIDEKRRARAERRAQEKQLRRGGF